MRRLFLAALALLCGVAIAHAGTATWTWPTQRTDNSVLPLSAIGGFTVYDTSMPVPGFPGTVVAGCVAAIPPVTATGTCTAAFVVGHTYVMIVGDNASPSNLSAVSNVATATGVIVAPPKAVTNLIVIGP